MQTTINKKAIQASFSKAATHYDQFADLQREIGHVLIDSVVPNIKQSKRILDLGCGTGYFSALLSERAQSSSTQAVALTCFDLSPAMLAETEKRNLPDCNMIEGDIDALPFHSPQFDLVFSNLVVQWSEQLRLSLAQTREALVAGGVFCFSTLLDGTLSELQQAWKQVDDNAHVNQFLTKDQVQRAVEQAGFQHFTLHTETRVKKYANVVAVMRALKGIGANHVHNSIHSHFSGRHLLKQLEEGYQPFIDQDGLYNLTYQVCYVTAYNQEMDTTLNEG